MTDRASTSLIAMEKTTMLRTKGRIGSAVVALVLAGGLGACMREGDVTSSIPSDYRQRHPIVIGNINETMDVFASNGRLDYRQVEDIRAFGRAYMSEGQGPLIAYLPAGGHGAHVSGGLNQIRGLLAAGGASGRLQIAHYQPQHGGPAPIRLAYAKLAATVQGKCGYEGDSITPRTIRESAANRTAYNFGCAYQQNLAAQVADPRDLLRPRQDGPVDVNKRVNGIQRLRDGGMNELKPGGTSIRSGLGG